MAVTEHVEHNGAQRLQGRRYLTYRHLLWITVITPAVFLGVFEYTRHTLLDHVLSIWAGSILVVLAVATTSYAFSRLIFGVISRLQKDVVLRSEELAALYQAGTEISALLDSDRVVALVAQKARDLLGTDVAGVNLMDMDEETRVLSWRLLVGGTGQPRQIRVGLGEGIAGHVVRTGRPLTIADWQQPPAGGPVTAPIMTLEGLRSALAVPLRSGRRTFGVLMVATRVPTTFGDSQIALLSSLANQAAVSIENAKLYRKVQSLAVLEERERIAREMHDGFGQVLGYVNTKTQAVTWLLEEGRVDEARVQIAQLEVAAREVYADVREAILGLRTKLDPEGGFLPALREYLEGFEQQSGIPVKLHAPGADAGEWPPLVAEVQLLRIVQEALANVRKHAQASRAIVRLTTADGTLQLAIEDNGRGFDSAHLRREDSPHFGLQTMRERAEAIGGTFAVESRPGAGTRVVVMVPQIREEVYEGANAHPAS